MLLTSGLLDNLIFRYFFYRLNPAEIYDKKK